MIQIDAERRHLRLYVCEMSQINSASGNIIYPVGISSRKKVQLSSVLVLGSK